MGAFTFAVAIFFLSPTVSVVAGPLPLAAFVSTPTPTPTPTQTPTQTSTPIPDPSFVPMPLASLDPKMFQLGGEADVGFTRPGADATLQFKNMSNARVFDTVPNVPDVQNLYLTNALKAGPLGGEVDLSFGHDAEVLHSYDQRTAGFDVTQTYLAYTAHNVTLQAGKFFTLAGAEFARSALNEEYSRSILFGYAIPFTHTGVRLTYAPNAKVSYIAGENLGWDQFKQTTGGDTLEGGILFNPSPAVNFSVQTYNGNESDTLSPLVSSVVGHRILYDSVLTLKASNALTITGNYDYASQMNASLFDAAGRQSIARGIARWGGFAMYLNYAITPKWSATLRGETFYDHGGYRTGIDQRWNEGTLATQFEPSSRMIFRAEYRDDFSNQFVFAQANGSGLSSLGTFGLEAIVKL
jgi:hypothetical protein